MIRNIKVLLLAGLAVCAVGALTASAASAAQFTAPAGGNTVITLKPDGTGTQAHHVFDVPGNPSITCQEIQGEGTESGTSQTEVTVQNIEYHQCEFFGVTVQVRMNGCDYHFRATGTVEVKCSGANEVEFEGAGCLVKVPSQTQLSTITYSNSGTEEITVASNVQGIQGNRQGCLQNGAFTTGRYTTGNTKVTGESDPGTTMKQIQFDA